MTRRRRALLAGASVAVCAVAFALLVPDGAVDQAAAPDADPPSAWGPSGVPGTTGVVTRERPSAPASSTTTAVIDSPGSGPAVPAPPHHAPPTTVRPPSAPTTRPAVDDTPVLLAVAAPAPAVPVRPSGHAAVARQRFVSIDAKATVDQLMGDRLEAVPGGFRRAGKPVKLLLFDEQPIRLEPVAPYVKESGVSPAANANASGAPTLTLTTYSWMGTTPPSPTTPAAPHVTASLSVTQDGAGTYQLTGTITTAADVPPLQLDHVDADRYVLTELTTGIPCLPEVVGSAGGEPTTTLPSTTTTTTADPACTG